MSDKSRDISQVLAIAANELYLMVLQKCGKKIVNKILRDATQEEKDLFIERMLSTHATKAQDRILLLANRILTDLDFIEGYNGICGPCKPLDEAKQDNEIDNNKLQSIENECSILQRDIDMEMDRFEKTCEDIMEPK